MLIEEVIVTAKELIISINLANQSFYFTGNKIIPDDQYDQMVKELREILEQYPNLVFHNNPFDKNKRVVQEQDRYHAHIEPYKLNSVVFMDQSLSNSVLEDYIEKGIELMGPIYEMGTTTLNKCPSHFISEVYSGVNISLIYKDGLLNDAILIGNGLRGKSILNIARSIINVPIEITSHDEKDIIGTIYIRGVITIPKIVYDSYIQKHDYQSTNPISVSKRIGYTTVINNILNSDSNNEVIDNPLSFIAENIVFGDDSINDFTLLSDKMMWLESAGFTISKYRFINDLTKDNYKGYLHAKAELNTSVYPLAGFNLSTDNIKLAMNISQMIGSTKIITFRLSKMRLTIIVNEVLFTIDNHDCLETKFNVHDNNAINNQHTLSIDNGILATKTLCIGDSLDVIVFDNSIIEILEVNKTNLSGDRIHIPKECPVCNKGLIDRQFDLMCINTKCETKAFNITKRYVTFNDNQKRLVNQEIFSLIANNLIINPIALFNKEYITNEFIPNVRNILHSTNVHLTSDELTVLTSQTMASLIPRVNMTIYDIFNIYNITDVELGMLNGLRLNTFADLISLCDTGDIMRAFVNASVIIDFVNQPHIRKYLLEANIEHPLVEV